METLEKTGASQTGANGATPGAIDRPRRPTLDELDLPTGKKARLHRLMYEHGPGNGSMAMFDRAPHPDAAKLFAGGRLRQASYAKDPPGRRRQPSPQW